MSNNFIKTGKRFFEIKNNGNSNLTFTNPPLAVRLVQISTVAKLLVAFGVSACTSITIVDREDKTRIERSVGFATIELHPSTEAVIAEVTALGYHGGPMGASIGFQHSFITALPNAEKCRLIVWLRDSTENALLTRHLGLQKDLCVISKPLPMEIQP